MICQSILNGRKTGSRTLVQCSRCSAVFQSMKFLKENEAKLGDFLCPPSLLLVLNRPEICFVYVSNSRFVRGY